MHTGCSFSESSCRPSSPSYTHVFPLVMRKRVSSLWCRRQSVEPTSKGDRRATLRYSRRGPSSYFGFAPIRVIRGQSSSRSERILRTSCFRWRRRKQLSSAQCSGAGARECTCLLGSAGASWLSTLDGKWSWWYRGPIPTGTRRATLKCNTDGERRALSARS